jgi:error-prone DNA polymerase
MGFYAPAQLIRDAREHGVEIRAPDVNSSDWDCTLEPASDGTGPALRLGLRQVKGLAEGDGKALLAARGTGYADPLEIWRRAGLKPLALEALARADAYRSQGLARREALWAVKRLPGEKKKSAPLPLFAAAGIEDRGAEPEVSLPQMGLSEHVVDDYLALRFSLKAHPLAFLREGLAREGVVESMQLAELKPGKIVQVAGLVLVRQRPGDSGVIFATLEDETGIANVIIWPAVFERYRAVVMKASLLAVRGRLQREGLVIHVVAEALSDLTHRLATLRPELTRADHAKHQGRDQRDPKPSPLRHPRNANPMPKSRDFH